MDKKTLLIVLAIAVIALGAWWLIGNDGAKDEGDKHILTGSITSIDRASQTFVVTVTQEVELNGKVAYQDTAYNISWNDKTLFLKYENDQALADNVAVGTQSGELQRNKLVEVTTKERSDDDRMAETILIYPGSTESEIEIIESPEE